MKYFTFVPYFYIEDETLADFECPPQEVLDTMLDTAVDVIRNHFDEIGLGGLGPQGADYYDLEPVLLDEENASPVFIDLSHCSNSNPVSSYDIETIATALKMPCTNSVIINCYGRELRIDKDLESFFSYVVGEKRFRSPFEAAVYAVNHFDVSADALPQE